MSPLFVHTSVICSPQVVKEKMLCHAIIGRAGGKELIMKVNVNCEFISPLLEFSTEDIFFRVDKVRYSSFHNTLSIYLFYWRFFHQQNSIELIIHFPVLQIKFSR